MYDLELRIKTDLQAELDAVRAVPALLARIYRALDAERLALLQNYFMATPPTVHLSWPNQPPVAGAFILQLAPSNEVGGPIGQAIDEEVLEAENKSIQTLMSVLSLQYKITATSAAADTTIYLAHFALTALLKKRCLYEKELPLLESQLSIGDWEPQPQLYPDLIFCRSILLTGQYAFTWEEHFEGVIRSAYPVRKEVLSNG